MESARIRFLQRVIFVVARHPLAGPTEDGEWQRWASETVRGICTLAKKRVV